MWFRFNLTSGLEGYWTFDEASGTVANDFWVKSQWTDFPANDLTVVGSLEGGGGLGEVDLIYVPEPSTWALLAWGFAGLTAMGRGPMPSTFWFFGEFRG